MNDLIYQAKVKLIERELSPHDTGFVLNEIPFSSLDYRNPKEVFRSLTIDHVEAGGEK